MDTVPAQQRASDVATGVARAGTATPDGHWSTRGHCNQLDPDFFFDPANTSEALHICLQHCTVLRQCEKLALELRPRPYDCVMGGMSWPASHTTARRQAAAALDCPFCRAARRGQP